MHNLTVSHCATLVSTASPLSSLWNNANNRDTDQALEGHYSISVSTRISLFYVFAPCIVK